MYYFSPSTGGFYTAEIHGAGIPPDVVEVPNERHAELMGGQARGLRISAGAGGVPELAQPNAVPRAPQVVTRRQGLLALLAAGKLDTVELQIQNSPRAVQIAWEAAGTFERDNPLIEAMAPTLGLSPGDIDNLFTEAAKL